jgi:ribosomal subunit interface protein
MDITVRGKHEPVPKHLVDIALEKFEHLGRYLSTITSIDVQLYEDGSPKTGDGRIARVTVKTSGPSFVSKATSEDLKSSMDIAYGRLERKLTEFKRKRSGKPAHSRLKAAPADRDTEVSP